LRPLQIAADQQRTELRRAVAQAAIRAQAYRPVRSKYHDFLTTP
jgi:hypothetical protein